MLLFVVGVSLALGLVPRLEPVYRIGFAQWMAPRWGPCLPSLVYAPAFVSLWWGIVYAMDRRGILLRI